MRFLEKLSRKTKEYLLNQPKIQYAVGYNGLLRFIFNEKIDMKSIEQLILLTHYNQGLREGLEKGVLSQPDMKAIVEQRLPIDVDMKLFSSYPPESLGFKYHDFIKKNQISLFHYPARYLRQCEVYTYIFLRILGSHDIYHVLLEADCSYIGEALVASFTIRQIPQYSPPCVHLGAGLIRYSMESGHNFDEALEIFARGSELGKKAKQLFCVNWNDYWKKDIDFIRSELNIAI